MDKCIKEYVKYRPRYIKLRPTQPTEPLRSHEVPHYPWQKIAANFIDWAYKKYLIITENFSKYPFLFKLQYISVPTTITCFTELFSLDGSPRIHLHTMNSLSTPKNGISSPGNIEPNTQDPAKITPNKRDSLNSMLEH